ncbi:MAG: ABC transporter, partial [Candidatus Riflebacteria bacterium RBG_13_59_9]
MQRITAIYKKELKLYFDSPIAYIFIVVFLAVTSWLFFRTFFLLKISSMRSFFSIIPWMCLFFIPAVSMRLWAEERKTGSNELLMSLPLQEWEVVLGKYFAALTVYIVTIILTTPLALVVGLLGSPDWGVIIGSYLGCIFLGAAILAIGTFVSSLTTNQIVAFIISVLVVAAITIVGQPLVTMFLQGPFTVLVPYAEWLGMANHFASISRGVLDSRD